MIIRIWDSYLDPYRHFCLDLDPQKTSADPKQWMKGKRAESLFSSSFLDLVTEASYTTSNVTTALMYSIASYHLISTVQVLASSRRVSPKTGRQGSTPCLPTPWG